MSGWFSSRTEKEDNEKTEVVESNNVESNEYEFPKTLTEEQHKGVMEELKEKTKFLVNEVVDHYERQKTARETSNIHLGELTGFVNDQTEQVNQLNEEMENNFKNDTGAVKKRKRGDYNLIALDFSSKDNIKMPYDDKDKLDTFKDKLDWYKTYTRGYMKDEVDCNTEEIMEYRGREFTFKPETPKEETPKEETEKQETIFTFNDAKIMYLRTRDLDFTILMNLGYTSYDDYDKINGSMENNLTTIRIKNGEIISEQNEGIDIPFYDLNLISQRVILEEIMRQEGCLYDLSDDNEFRFRLRKFQMNSKNLNIKFNLCSREHNKDIFTNWARETNKNKVDQKNKKEMDGFVGYMNKKTNNSYIITKLASRMNTIKGGDVIFMDDSKYPSRWSILDNYRPIYYDRRYSGWIVGLSQYENLCKLGVKFVGQEKLKEFEKVSNNILVDSAGRKQSGISAFGTGKKNLVESDNEEEIVVSDSEYSEDDIKYEINVMENFDEDDSDDEDEDDSEDDSEEVEGPLDGWKAFISTTGNSYTLKPINKDTEEPQKITKITKGNVWYEDVDVPCCIKWNLYPNYRTLYYNASQKGWCISFDYREKLIEDGCIVVNESRFGMSN